MSHEKEQNQMVMFVCSQLPKQKGIMPKESSREVQTTKDSDLIKIFKKKLKTKFQTNTPPQHFLSLFPVL